MQKITRKIICVLLCIVVALGISIATGVQATKDERRKNTQKLNTVYANIVYAFSSGKEKDLLRFTTNIIRNEIIYINKDYNNYAYLCPMLNNSFKNLLLKFINEEKKKSIDKNVTMKIKLEIEDFQSEYEKLYNFCNKNRARKNKGVRNKGVR